MSTLCFRLKHRAKMVAAGLALSAATLVIIPGVASATGCIDPCTGGGLGDTQNTNSADYTVGQVAAQDGVDLNSNLNASPNTTALSPGSYQETDNQQSIDSDVYGGTQSTNEADHTVGQVVVQDGVDLNTNTNVSPNTSLASPGSYQESGNTQDVYGGDLGDTQNTNDASYTVGQVALQDGVDSGVNLNASPNTSLASPGSYQGSYNDQSVGYGDGYGGEQNTNSADYTVGQVAAQDGVDLNSNLNASPNTTALSPGSYQEANNQQSIGGTSANNGGHYSGAQNTNQADHTVGQAVLQDGVDSSINANISPNASVLSPGSEQKAENTQNTGGDFASNGVSNGYSTGGGEQNDNSADHTIGQAVVQDGVDLNTNANVSPNASILSPGSKQETDNEQGIDGSVSNDDSSSNGASSNKGETQNDNKAEHTVGQAVLQDGVDSNLNANISPNASVLSPGSEQKTDNSQNTGASNTGGSGSEKNSNEADHSVGQVVGQDLADLNTNANVSPNVSVLSPGSKQETHNKQNIGDGSAGNGDSTGGSDQNTNNADHTVGQILLQDVLDNNTNVNTSPNTSILSPGSEQKTDNHQSIGGGDDCKTNDCSGNGGNDGNGDGDNGDNGGETGDQCPPSKGGKQRCDSGNGNGSEDCDPGNSAPQNRGGDEVPGNSKPNPGGNNVA